MILVTVDAVASSNIIQLGKLSCKPLMMVRMQEA